MPKAGEPETRGSPCGIHMVRLKWGERSKMGDLIGVLVDGHPVER